MRVIVSRAAGVVGLVLVLAGCSTTATGTGRAGITPTTALRLDGVDPCAVIGPTARSDLGVTTTSDADDISGTLFCSYRIVPGHTFQVILAPDKDLDRYIGVFAEDADTTPTTIGGRPAVVAVDPEADGYSACTVAIAVAPESVVGVVGNDSDGDGTAGNQAVCDDARSAATAAVSGVLTRR